MRRPHRARLSAAVAAALLSAALVTPVASADPKADAQTKKSKVDSDIVELTEDLAGTSVELTGAYTKLAEAQGQLPAAQAALDAARAVEAEATRKDAEMAGRLAAAEQAQVEAQAAADGSATEIAGTREQIGRLAAASYRRGAVGSEQWSVVMRADSPDDFADRYVLADTLARSHADTMNNLVERAAVQANAQTRLDAVTAQVADLREQARRALAAAEAARADAAAKKSAVDTLIADAAAATAVIESRKAEEEAQLSALKAEQDSLTAQLKKLAEEERAAAARKAAASSSTPAPQGGSGGGSLANPINTYKTSNFGYRIHPIYKYKRMHTGTDFGGGCSIPVRAAADGRVISAGSAGGYGNRIVVSHGLIGGNSLATTYNHLSSYAVRGGSVSRGQVIGYTGSTGASTACHLHFEVLKNGSYVDPMGYL